MTARPTFCRKTLLGAWFRLLPVLLANPFGPAQAALVNAVGVCSPDAATGDSALRATSPTVTGAGTPEAASAGQSFHLSVEPDLYRIDTGAGLIVGIRRTPLRGSHQGPGDIVSLNYDHIEYQERKKGSQLNSGFRGLYGGQHDVDMAAQQVDQDHIRVTVTAGQLTHYYLFRRGVPAVFMATYFTQEPVPALARFVVRIPHTLLPDGPGCADVLDHTGTIEAHDVFVLPNGETRSKHYANNRLQDWVYFGARGRDVGVWMIRDNNEGGSGGPFYRSLRDQGASDQELTYIINYGEAQTEPFRMGVLNSYTLYFTHGEPPSGVDTSWFDCMDLRGYAPHTARGALSGQHLLPVGSRDAYTVALANAHVQYWGTVDRHGEVVIRDILPGQYQATLYKGELAVAEQPVAVAAGRDVRLPAFTGLHDPQRDRAVWRVGRWDGKPVEFRNGDKLTWMHPSDVRMRGWQTADFVVGRSGDRDFPAYEWQDVNNDLTLRFTLRPDQLSHKALRIGITDAWMSGRPTVQVNQWQSAIPAPSSQPKSRTATVGSYRGNNVTYRFDIPDNVLQAGENQLTIRIVSGQRGQRYLSPGVAFDAIDLVTK